MNTNNSQIETLSELVARLQAQGRAVPTYMLAALRAQQKG